MKATIFSAAAICLVSSSMPAQAQAQRFQQEAVLVFGESEFLNVWIGDSTKTDLLYFETEKAVDSKKLKISRAESIWLIEPAEYREAMELYQGRDYAKAAAKFAEVRKKYIRLRELPNNHSALAAFYGMECLRRQGKLDELAKAQELFVPDDRKSLTREHQLRQLELYVLWDAVRTKDWSRLESLCNEKLEVKMPGYQRAQVGYCLGLALEGQKKAIPAINAYNIGMTADTGASERITAEGARNALRLYTQDESVQLAMKLFGTPDEEPQSAGAQRLNEAASLASLYELTLGDGDSLPAESKALLKYLVVAAPAAPEPKEEAKAAPKAEEGDKKGEAKKKGTKDK